MAFGSTILVPVTHPKSAVTLLRLAASLADPGGLVVPVTVLAPDARASERQAAHDLVVSAEATACEGGVTARGMVDVDASVASGVLDTARECEATLVLIGWQGRSSHQNVFGSLIDSIAGRSAVPLAVARLGERTFRGLLLPVSDDHLASTATGGVLLAAGLTRRLHEATGVPVRVVRSGAGTHELPPEVASLSDRIHHDPRRLDLAVGAAARPDDLVVVPVAPTVSGLRAATTHVAWAVPEASLLIAVDVGPAAAEGNLASAVSRAGRPTPPEAPTEPRRTHRIRVTACLHAERDRSAVLASALSAVGEVTMREPAHDDRGRLCVEADVATQARDTNSALGEVMEALHHAPGFDGAEISYTPLE